MGARYALLSAIRQSPMWGGPPDDVVNRVLNFYRFHLDSRTYGSKGKGWARTEPDHA